MSLLSLNHQSQSLAERLSRLQPAIDESTARLSSGSRLVRASSDPVGTGVAMRYEARQARWQAAAVNLQNSANRLQVTDGVLASMGRTLERMGELATLAKTPAYSATDRAIYTGEFVALQQQLRSIVGGSTAEIGGTADVAAEGTFQDRDLFGAGPAGGERVPVGADASEEIVLPAINLRQGAIASLFQQDAGGAFTASLMDPAIIDTLKAATDQITIGRAAVGATQSRIDFAGSALTTARTNAEAALSEIRDTDVATETTNLARRQLVSEAHTAMLAQAREVPRQLLPLLTQRRSAGALTNAELKRSERQ